eukprot:3445653-Rhodomonas_salina.1
MFPGLPSRLDKELRALHTKHVCNGDAEQVPPARVSRRCLHVGVSACPVYRGVRAVTYASDAHVLRCARAQMC